MLPGTWSDKARPNAFVQPENFGHRTYCPDCRIMCDLLYYAQPAFLHASPQRNQMLLVSAIAASLFTAQEEPHTGQDPPTIIVSILWERDSRDAEEFLEALPDETTADGVPLREVLGNFVRAEPLFPFYNPAPEVYEIPEISANWLLRRYIKITYSKETDITRILQTLPASGKFGYVGSPPKIEYSAIPTDPYWNIANGQPAPYSGQNWAHQRLNLPAAWDYLTSPSGLAAPQPQTLTGGTRIAVLDSGVYLNGPVLGVCDLQPHEDLTGNLRSQMSIGIARTVPIGSACDGFEPFPPEANNPGGHGTHVLGLISASANNGLGAAGVCWSCPTGIASNAADAATLNSMLQQAPAIVSLSFGFQYGTRPVCNFQSSDHPWCPLLQLAEEREQIIVAAAGNDLTLPKFPAYHFSVLGVGGLGVTVDPMGRPRTWDDRTTSGGAGCPATGTVTTPPGWPGPVPVSECGTNDDTNSPIAFFAPAKDVLSSFGPSYIWSQPGGCTDVIDPLQATRPGWQLFALASQYDYCTGTSMSTPLMAAAVGVVRSAHPVLDRGSFLSVLRDSRLEVSTPAGVRDGLLDTNAAIETLLGKFGSTQLQNRLTPVFALKNTLEGTFQIPSHGSWLFTTSLPVAYAAMDNTLYKQATDTWVPLGSWAYNEGFGPNIKIHRISEAGIRNFAFNATFDHIHAGAYFFIFTTPKNPLGQQVMRPLYRMSFDDMFNNSGIAWCMGRDHSYAINQAGLNWFTGTDFCSNQSVLANQSFRLEGLEGYLLASCPSGMNCTSSGSPFQCLHLRGRATAARPAGEDWALVPYTMLPENTGGIGQFAAYTVTPSGAPTPAAGERPGCLGYAAMNIDSDGDAIIDGAELSFFTGAVNPHLNPNIDGDLFWDDVEYQPLGLVMSNPLLACSTSTKGECDGLFRNSFEGLESFYDSP